MEHHHHSATVIPEGAPTAIDPVCGMTVAVGPETRKAQFAGKTFHFCSAKCDAQRSKSRSTES